MLEAASIRPMASGEPRECERVLRSLPEWFGIESALVKYVEDCSKWPTRVAVSEGRIRGFLTIHRHFEAAAEIHCIAVEGGRHRRGLGRALVQHAEDELRSQGVRFLQVKTMGPSRPCEHYALTHRFYEGMGFAPLEEFLTLWPGNPALQMIKRL